MTRQLLLCSLLILFCSLVALADTLMVAGRTQYLTVPLEAVGDEVLAPITPSLRLLGVTAAVKGSAVTLTSPAAGTAHSRTVKMTLGSTTAEADGRRMTLPAAPRMTDEQLYLPVRALAAWLGVDVYYDSVDRMLALHPILQVSYEAREGGVAILLHSAAPVQYTSGKLSDPPRLYYDFKNVSLGMAEQQVPVESGVVQRMRLSQYCAMPSIVRLVVDLTDGAQATAAVSEGGRLVTITIHPKAQEPVRTPAPAPEVLPDLPVVPAAPTRLLGAALQAQSSKQTELAVQADGPVQVSSEYDQQARQLTLCFDNAVNAIPGDALRGLTDRMVAKVETETLPHAGGVKLVLSLKQNAGYLLSQEPLGVRVLLGTFDIANMVVVLDAGHGGHDSGAVGVGGTREKNIVIDVVQRAARLLKNAGAKVLMTRCDDTFIPLDNRPGLANKHGADLFISVHCNSTAKPNSANGTQTYYKTPQSTQFASAMHTELVKSLGLRDGKVHTANFLVIRKSLMPSVLLELAFINNQREENLLNSPDFRQKAAEGILNGVRRYAATRDWQYRQKELSLDESVRLAEGTVAPTP